MRILLLMVSFIISFDALEQQMNREIFHFPDQTSDDNTIQVPRISSSKSDILCGVSNVIYRKEFILRINLI